MKRLELKKLITCALIISTVTSIGVMPAKATTTSDLYKQAYDATMRVIETGKEYNIAPRHADNNTDLKSNKLDNIYEAVEKGNMQKAINHARECIARLSSNQWQAKNTFSNLLDGYQQPSYEHIVDVALQLNKLTQQDKNKFENPTNWDESKKQEFRNTVKERQHYIEIARALNKGVDPSYGKTYSSALDKPQQTVINMVNVVVEDAKKSSKPSDIEFAESVVKAFKESVSENSNIKNYVTGLQKDMDSLVELSKNNKAALEAQAKQIEVLKQEVAKLKNESHKEDFEKEINSLKGEIANLKNTSQTIIPIPSNQEAIDTQAKLIKELQEQIKNGNPSDYEEFKKFTKRKQDEDALSNVEENLTNDKKTIDNFLNKKENIDIDGVCRSLKTTASNFNSIKISSILAKEKLNNVKKNLINESERIYPSVLEYLKKQDISSSNSSGTMFYDDVKYIYAEDSKKLDEMKLAIKEYQNEIANKQIEELNKISKELNNITEDDQAPNLRKRLSQFSGTNVFCNEKIKENSIAYPKLVEVCNQYVDTAKKFIDKAKNTLNKKDISIAESMILYFHCEGDKFLPSCEKELFKISYDFIDFCVNPNYATKNTMEVVIYTYNMTSFDDNFDKFLISKVPQLISKDILKDESLIRPIDTILCSLECRHSKTSDEHKTIIKLQNKFKVITKELNEEKQGHHEVINSSQENKDNISSNLEYEKFKKMTKQKEIEDNIKKVKEELRNLIDNTPIDKFSKENINDFIQKLEYIIQQCNCEDSLNIVREKFEKYYNKILDLYKSNNLDSSNASILSKFADLHKNNNIEINKLINIKEKMLKNRLNSIESKYFSLGEIKKISNKEFQNLKSELYNINFSCYAENPKIVNTNEYNHLKNMCEKYVSVLEQSFIKYKETKSEKDMITTEYIIGDYFHNICDSENKRIEKIAYDFLSYCLDIDNITPATIKVAKEIYIDGCGRETGFAFGGNNKDFEKLISNKVGIVLKSSKIKDKEISKAIDDFVERTYIKSMLK